MIDAEGTPEGMMGGTAKGWYVRRELSLGGLGATTFWAMSPGCPPYGHAIRYCTCRVFGTRHEAMDYIDEQNQSVKIED